MAFVQLATPITNCMRIGVSDMDSVQERKDSINATVTQMMHREKIQDTVANRRTMLLEIRQGWLINSHDSAERTLNLIALAEMIGALGDVRRSQILGTNVVRFRKRK
jgi:hypothetical protein